jgi:D-apiose dehydrogenase
MVLVGVSGLGSIGRQHIAVLAARGDVEVAVFDPVPEARHAASGLPAVTTVHDDLDDLLDSTPAALVIAGPDHVHLQQLEAAVRRRIPTLVEKPLAPHVDDALAAVATIRRARAPVLVGYVLRHRTVVREVRRHLEDGAIGAPVSYQVMLGAYATITAATSRFARPEPNRLYRDYSHEWDYLRWYFGPIAATVGHARTVHDVDHVESPNVVDALLQHGNGVTGAVHIDYVEPRGLRTLHVIGTGGSLMADLTRGTLTLRRSGETHDQLHVHVEAPAAALGRQADHLLAIARGEEEPVATLDDGIAALAMADALIRSADERAWTAVAVPH